MVNSNLSAYRVSQLYYFSIHLLNQKYINVTLSVNSNSSIADVFSYKNQNKEENL